MSWRAVCCIRALRVIYSGKKAAHKIYKHSKTEKNKNKRGKRMGEWHVLDSTTAWVCSEVPDAMLVRAQAASNWREGLQEGKEGERYRGRWSKVKSSFDDSLYPHGYLSSLSRQFTSLGRIPDLMRSSIGGLRSLDSSFLEKQIQVLLHQPHVMKREYGDKYSWIYTQPFQTSIMV